MKADQDPSYSVVIHTDKDIVGHFIIELDDGSNKAYWGFNPEKTGKDSNNDIVRDEKDRIKKKEQHLSSNRVILSKKQYEYLTASIQDLKNRSKSGQLQYGFLGKAGPFGERTMNCVDFVEHLLKEADIQTSIDDILTKEQKKRINGSNLYRENIPTIEAVGTEAERMDRSLDINRDFWSRFGSTLYGKLWRGDNLTTPSQNEQKVIIRPEPEAQPSSFRPTGHDNPDLAALLDRIAAPLPDPGTAALLKPLQDITESEMKAMIHTAQTAFRGWRYADPLKARLYERVQEWFEDVYGNQETPRRPILEQNTINTTPDGQDLWQASAGIGQILALATEQTGLKDTVESLQRGLNLFAYGPQPDEKPLFHPLQEDGQYGPQTDFAVKSTIARKGRAAMENLFALGRFNRFIRQAKRDGDGAGLDQAVATIFGTNSPRHPRTDDQTNGWGNGQEGQAFQTTLNEEQQRRPELFSPPLKTDNQLGPVTTQAFNGFLQNRDSDPDQFSLAFGKTLGMLR